MFKTVFFPFIKIVLNVHLDITILSSSKNNNSYFKKVRNIGTNLCIDSMGHKNSNGEFEVGWCHKMAGNQLFRLNEANQLSQYDQCVCMHGRNGGLTQTHCDENQFNDWEYKEVRML